MYRQKYTKNNNTMNCFTAKSIMNAYQIISQNSTNTLLIELYLPILK